MNLLRKHLSILINVALILVTLSISVLGFLTYKDLNTITANLQQETRPNENFHLYKDIMIAISHMEDQISTYRLSKEEKYLENFRSEYGSILLKIDSIKAPYPNDVNHSLLTDSLLTLFTKYHGVLKKIAQLENIQFDNAFSDLESGIGSISNQQDSASSKRVGYLKRIFKSKKNEEQKLEDLESQLEKLLSGVEESTLAELRKIDQLELNYSRQMNILQLKMLELLDYLENREITKTKINTLNAQELISRTKYQITLFSLLATALLMITIWILFIFTTRSKKYNAMLRKAKKNAEQLARSKEQFLANMSHEIRTPLNAITGFTNQLSKTELNDGQKEQVSIIHEASNHLLSVLNDILDITKLQSEKVELEKEQFNFTNVIKSTAEIMKIKAKEQGNEIAINIVSETPQVVLKGDSYRLKQILLNLLGNSIKFTTNGNITVSARTSNLSPKRLLLELKIKDTGVGIPKENQEKIFEEFEQASNSSAAQGTGLGLSIVKKIVELHHGQMALQSEVGIGTEITVILPYDIVPEGEIIKSPSAPEEVGFEFSDLTVLVADDEVFNIKLLQAILSDHATDIKMAQDGAEALRILENQKVDIALLDIKMPHHTGWQIVNMIRNGDGPNKNTPMIALTATIAEEAHLKGARAGFNRLMRKPFPESELLQNIKMLLPEKTHGIDIAHEEVNLQVSFSVETLEQLGDKEFVKDMLETFVDSSTANIAEMHDALQANDLPRLSNLAHKTVAPARHLDAKEFVLCLKAIETTADAGNTPQQKDIQQAQQLHQKLLTSISNYLD
ncbi:MAG: ATP-binding protein [Cyclobacteriaceae bacterium]